MSAELEAISSHPLPRVIKDDLLWTGGCLPLRYGGDFVHSHFGVFVVKGSEKSIIIDTGHPIHAEQVEQDIENFLQGRPLDYIFPTHGEFPHAGLISRWMKKYPEAIAVGDLRDYDLYYPEIAHRFQNVKPGDSVSLGDRDFLFVPAIWRDLPNSLWGFDTLDRTLYVADAFSLMHYHIPGDCSLLTSEMPPPDLKMIRFLNERAMQWARYFDARETFPEIDRLLAMLKPRHIASAHGAFIDTPDVTVRIAKEGMIL